MPLPADAPARREWALVCDSRDYPACVTGWEFPGQPQAADAGRRFEVIWSVDPQVVRDAAVLCAQLARSVQPGLGPILDTLPSEPPAPASADLRRAAGLLTRMTSYLEKAESVSPPAAHRLPEQAEAKGGDPGHDGDFRAQAGARDLERNRHETRMLGRGLQERSPPRR